jgi:hypothetical protein
MHLNCELVKYDKSITVGTSGVVSGEDRLWLEVSPVAHTVSETDSFARCIQHE